MVNGVEGQIITFFHGKLAVRILRKGRMVYTLVLVLWCILPLAHSCTLVWEPFGTSDGALGDILVWELSGTFGGELVCIPVWEHFGTSVGAHFCILACNTERRVQIQDYLTKTKF